MTRISPERAKELRKGAQRGPWKAVDEDDNGKKRPDTSRLMRSASGEYLGIMHTPGADLAALAPDMARELLRLRRELTELRVLMQTHAQYLAQDGLRTAAEYAYDHALRLTRVLDGGTE